MLTLKRLIFITILEAIVVCTSVQTGLAQYTSTDVNVRDTVQRIQSRTETLRSDIQLAANRGNVSSSQLDQLYRSLADFTNATRQLDRRLAMGRATSADARFVLDRASTIDDFFRINRVGSGANRDWQEIRTDLDVIARAYNLNWQQSTGDGSNTTSSLNSYQIRQLIQEIDTNTTAFSRYVRQDLNRVNRSRAYSDQEIRNQLTQLESAVVTIRNTNARQINTYDVSNLLDRAAYFDRVISDRQFSYQAQNSWTPLREDFERLANAFNLSWNSSNPDGGYRSGLTGTYQLNTSRGDDARRMADAATRNLPVNDRQRVYDSLLRRLDPPSMLAIDQRGNAVTIASSRASQINFVADGREKVETTPSGRTIRVRATLTGDQLSIVRSGDRSDDFSVTFDSDNSGRQLIVTRTLYSDRLSQPVIVRTYYDRTSDVAQLNIYETNPDNANVGGNSGEFVIPNGTQIVAVLNNNLTTATAREKDRFSMTVRSPAQYEASTIEGYVTNVDRSGRISGRAGMTLNFDTIRLRNGTTYRFAGILESARASNGDTVQVDNEGAIRDDESQTSRTITRTAIGTGVGAIIGAIAGGGKGAAIGAVIGAGAGAGSVYVQGRNDLQLPVGTEMVIRTTGPR